MKDDLEARSLLTQDEAYDAAWMHAIMVRVNILMAGSLILHCLQVVRTAIILGNDVPGSGPTNLQDWKDSHLYGHDEHLIKEEVIQLTGGRQAWYVCRQYVCR